MTLQDALTPTGCAFFMLGDVTVSVECLPKDRNLPDKMYLLVTRREGTGILLCLMVRWDYLMGRYALQTWHPGQVQIASVQGVDTTP